MKDEWWPWVMRGLWVSLPFTVGGVLGNALEDFSRPVELTGVVGSWALWGVSLVCVLIPHTLTLTPLRIIAPATVPLAIWAVTVDGVSGAALSALTLSVLAALVSLSPQLAAWSVNGTSYGDEQRLPLRAPGALLLGPIPLAWLTVIAGAVTGPILLAARQWVVGGIVTVVGFAAAAVAVRALHSLTRRWLVFVPAGVVVHDGLSLGDPVLFKRSAVQSFGPALEGTDALDLSQGALGLALELRVRKPLELSYLESPRAKPRTEELHAVIVSASRPGAVLELASRRGIAIG